MLNQAGNRWEAAGLDEQSRRHLGLIVRQTLLMAAICLPFALVNDDPLTEYLLLLRITFGFSSFAIFITAALSRAPLSRTSLCIWDHGAALLLLKFGCALALDGLA
jgi:hypothetical protein